MKVNAIELAKELEESIGDVDSPTITDEETRVIVAALRAHVQPEDRTFILLATEKGLTPIGKVVDALQAFVVAEDEWRKEKGGMPEGTFNDPLARAYAKAKAALEQFSMYTDNIAVASQAEPQHYAGEKS